MKLTMARIADLECPPGSKDRLVFDDEQKGLAVRVTAGGSKSYLVQFSINGQKRRLPLGSVSAISLKAARDAAKAALGMVARGVDPAAERAAAKEEAKRKANEYALTLDALLEDWRALRLADKRERYAVEALRALRRAFAKQLDQPASELTRTMVVRTLDAMSRSGSMAMAARTAAYGRACYSWATKRSAVAVNPFENLPATTIAKRERVLSDEELVAIWRATEGQGSFNHIVRTLVLTGQRREEVARMAWVEISPDIGAWTIPSARAKNGAAHIVPLSSPVADLLRASPRHGELVFPGDRGAFAGFSKAKAALDARSGVANWRLHDLRRTMATGLQRLGVRLEVTEAVLNHTAGSRAGVVGIYQRHDYAAEKRAALDAWAEHVMALVEGRREDDNVISMQRRNQG